MQRLAKLPKYLTWAAATYALLGGLLSFAGWATGTYRLTDWVGGGITMKVNTSLAAAAAGAALLLGSSRVPGSRPIVRALGVFVAALGGLTLLEHVSGWDFGIDTLLLDEPPGAAATAAPGRMGPPASTSFLALGIALVLLTCGAPARRFSAALGLAVLAIGMLSLVGHWYGAERMYTIPRLTGIAAQTATMIVALGIGVIASNPDRQPMRTLIETSIAGQLARRLVPLVIGVPLVLGWIRVEGQQLGLYDGAFGTAIRTVVEVILFSAFVWWSIRAIQERDVQRRRAEDGLRLSEQRLGQTLASITDGFVTLDREWRFTYVNREAERFMGRPASALLGQTAWSVFPAVVGSRLYEELHRAMHERVMVEVESAQDGRYFNNRVFPAGDGGVSVYIQDVTLRKEAQDALREADRRKDEFIATLAHELRNPLAPISNATRLLEAKATSEPTIAWATDVIGRQVRHMARLLEDLLDVSRITLNRLELRRQWMDLTETVRGIAEASRPNIDAAGHELTVELPDEPVYIDGDAVRLSQVLANLLTNAAKYTERGGRIRVALRCEGTEVVLSVSDDGIGIPKEMLPRVFEMFVQGTSHHAEGGLGIGLWLAKGVVERHGGRVEALSAGLGAGSEFVVRLPLLAGLVGGTATAADSSLPDTPSRRVLVVDDLGDSADTLALLLESLGHDVKTAYGGEEALRVGSAFEPEVIFLDIGMPDVDGCEACRRIRKTPWGRDVCIVALTGWGQPEDRRRTEEAGFDLHLIKPVDPDTLPSLFEDLPKAVAAAAG